MKPLINITACRTSCLNLLRILSVPWISFQLVAATTSGVMSQDETWSGRLLLTGDVTVPANVTLTVMPGTTVECAPDFDDMLGGADSRKTELIIAGGSLTAVGTAQEPIIFTSAATTPDRWQWYGIRTVDAAVVLNHCELRYAYVGLYATGGSPPHVQNSRFLTNHIGATVDLSGQTVSFQNCYFDSNRAFGINPLGTRLRLVSSVIEESHYGIYKGDFVELIDCAFSNNGWDTVGGVQGQAAVEAKEVVVRDSTFVRNNNAILATTAWITNSVFTSNRNLAVRGNSGAVVNCTVKDNESQGGAVNGLDLYHCEIIDNVYGVSRARSIADCVIKGNLGFGVDNCGTVIDSTVEDNGGIGLRATNVVNCIVRNNGYGGVVLLGGNMTDCLVESNGFGVVASVGGVMGGVTGCTVVDNRGTGINSENVGTFSIRDSTVAENAGHGISGIGITATGNRITGNGEAGIRFNSALQPGALAGNVIQSNRVGLLAVFPAQSLSNTGITSNIISDNLEHDIRNTSPGRIIADGNYWGEPTTTELNAAVANLTKVYDSHDAPLEAGEVLIRSWSNLPGSGGPVVIVEGLQDQSVSVGEVVTWTVVAEGGEHLVYQWLKDGVAIGNSSDTLHLSQVALHDAGLYSVVVGNLFASASSSARLTVADENASPPPLLDLKSFVGITVYGAAGKSYRVDYATDLATSIWVPLTNITLSTSHYFFFDTESAGPSKRFYRAIELPVSSP